MRPLHVLSLALLLVSTPPSDRQGQNRPESQRSWPGYESLSRAGKLDTIGGLLNEKFAVPDRVEGLLSAGIRDQDSVVAARSLYVLAGRVSTSDPAVWRQETAVYEAFRPIVIELMSAEDLQVRSAAVQALGAIEMDRTASKGQSLRLSAPAATAIVARLDFEPDRALRGRMIRMLGMYEIPAAFARQRAEVLTESLETQDEPVVQAAIQAVWERRRIEHLPLVVKNLAHQTAAIRIFAAQAVASFKVDALPYLPQVEAALGVEKDAMARATLSGVVTQLRALRVSYQ